MNADSTPGRIVSMDQFRGYTVAGMFVVNFLSSFAVIHGVLRHNDTYFSYADSIMPSFLFAVGFSFRLTYLRRRSKSTWLQTVRTYLRRSSALVLVSLVMYGCGGDFHNWADFDSMPPEFQSFREQPSRTTSFDVLLAGVREANPAKGQRTQLSAAASLGASLPGLGANAGAGAKESPVQRATSRALAEIQPFVPATIERIQAWNSLGHTARLLIHWRIFLAKLLKANLWETLAIIGASQLIVLPWIGSPFVPRFAVLVGLGLLHCVLSYAFNWDFVYGLNDNWMSKLWMTGESRSWDGGFFGPISWSVAMMAGTLAYDLVVLSDSHRAAAKRLFVWGAAFMVVGYALSCLTRLYEMSGEELAAMRLEQVRQEAEKSWLAQLIGQQQGILAERRQPLVQLQQQIDGQKRAVFQTIYRELRSDPANAAASDHDLADHASASNENHPPPDARLMELEQQLAKAKAERQPQIDESEAIVQLFEDQQRRYPNLTLAASPVLPPWERLKGRSLSDMLVEPPFVAPPADDPRVDAPPTIEHRQRNYWMMGKRMPSLSFMTFATGFAFALYAVFVLACDLGQLRVGLFTTFGTNALAAYFLHHMVEEAVKPLVPPDARLWYCLAGFALFFYITYVLVRFLEKRGIYLKL